MSTRQFHISDILSITSGRLVSSRHMGGIYDILNYMTGDNLFTHALPRAGRVCAPVLLAQHPQLADAITDEQVINADNLPALIVEWEQRFGVELAVTPLVEWQQRHPISELMEMVDPNKIIVMGDQGETN